LKAVYGYVFLNARGNSFSGFLANRYRRYFENYSSDDAEENSGITQKKMKPAYYLKETLSQMAEQGQIGLNTVVTNLPIVIVSGIKCLFRTLTNYGINGFLSAFIRLTPRTILS
jgi:hypothetical protein